MDTEPKSDRIDGAFLNDDGDDDEQVEHYDCGWMALFQFTERRHILALTAAISLAVLSGLVVPLMAVIMGKIFGSFASFGAEKITPEGLVAQVTSQIILLAVLGVGSWVVSGAFFAGWLFFGELQAKVAREKLFDGLVDKDMEWFDMRKSGVAALMSRVQTQIKELQTAVSQPLGFSIQAMVTAVVCFLVAVYTCWSLTLVILIGMPLALGFLAAISARIQVHIDTQKKHLAEATRAANRAFTAIEIVKAFNGQCYERKVFARVVVKAAEAYREQAHANAMIIGFIRLITLSMFVQGFWYGSRLVRRDQASSEDIMTTFWSCLMAMQSLELILPQMILLEKGRAAGAGLKALLVNVQRGRQVFDMRGGGAVPKGCEGEIEIRDVSFAYPSRPGQLALDRASFFIPSHETTFIIGKSGSGKSTLGNLILKAYDPLSGTITFDGNPLQHIDSEWLRKNVTLVQQQTVLFNETIFRNIAFGRKDYENATREEVRESCRMTMLEDTLDGFPLGSDTIVGVGGTALSGGQRQRVALARAIIQNAPVLVLDEATSALDYVSRSRIMDAIHTWRRGKTTIIITHDIAQIGPEDFVYVLEKGRVVEDGYRSDLEFRPDSPFQAFVRAFDTKEGGRKQSLIPELESDYDSEEDTPGADCMEKGSFGIPMNSSENFTTDLESLQGHEKTRRKGHVAFSPLMGVEMVHLPGNKVKQQPNRRLNVKRHFSDHLPPSSATEIGTTVPAAPRRRPVRSFESKEITLRQILATIWPSLGPTNRWLLLTGFAVASLHAAATPVFSFALAQLLRSFFEPKHPASESTKWSLVILGIAIIDAINSYLVHYLLESVAQAWVDTLRIRSLTRILGQPRVWFDENPVGAISEDLEKNAEEMKNLLGRFAGYAYIGVVMMLVGITWSFALSWELTAVGLCIAPVMYGMTRGFAWISDTWERKSNKAAAIVSAVFEETITNIRTVRALTLERYFRQKYAGAMHAASRVGMKRSLLAGIGFGLSDSTVMFASALIFWYGAVLVAKNSYSLGDILTVFTLLLFSLAGANTIVGFIPQINNSKDTARRVLRLYNLSRNSHESHGARCLDCRGSISFCDVNFTYPTRPDTMVLHNFNLEIAAGECVALVGGSGSGKSTLAALLQRLYCHSDGIIAIDGCPLQNLDVFSLRSQIAVVPQSAVLFGTSVHDNISYGTEHTRWEVERAARAAGIHEFIISLPDGYNTHVGDNGSHLSGGQAQRIVIARALIRNPTILILDECTSNLDPESTKVIRDTITSLRKAGEVGWKKMTVIIITHSQEMMQCAERVIVLSHGEVVEYGVFDELLEREGELHRLLSREVR